MNQRDTSTHPVTDVSSAGPRHNLIGIDHPLEWNAALEGIPHAFAHTWLWCHAIQRTTGLPTHLYTYASGSSRVVCPIAERSYADKIDIMTPPGFSGFAGTRATPSFPRAWRGFAASKGYICGFLGLHPVLTDGQLADPEETYAYNSIYVLDLTLGPDELFRRLSECRRRHLRDWERLAENLIFEREALIEFYVSRNRSFLEQRDASSATFFSEATLRELFDDPRVILIGAGTHGHLEAVTVFAHTDTIADFLFNVSTPEGRRHSTTLIWYGVQHLARLGISMLNLGGGIRPGDGVAQFKKRFNPQEHPLKALKQVFSKPVFDQLCREAGADPNDRSGFFPPYRSLHSRKTDDV